VIKAVGGKAARKENFSELIHNAGGKRLKKPLRNSSWVMSCTVLHSARRDSWKVNLGVTMTVT